MEPIDEGNDGKSPKHRKKRPVPQREGSSVELQLPQSKFGRDRLLTADSLVTGARLQERLAG